MISIHALGLGGVGGGQRLVHLSLFCMKKKLVDTANCLLKNFASKVTVLFLCVTNFFVCCRSHYVESVDWVAEQTISISWLSREQNLRVRTLCSAPRFYCSEVQV
jgi:hypothetical protein